MGQWKPGQSVYVFIAGKKGSGKSHLAYSIFESYPYSRLCIDVTHDVVDKWLRPLGIPYRMIPADAIPVNWPQPLDEDKPYELLVYQPDMGSPTKVDDMDRILGLALRKKRVLAWIDEIGTMTSGSKTPPNLSRALHHGRHDQLSLLMCGPRPMDIDVLCLAQADAVATFRLRSPADRKRVADNIGVTPAEFDQANAALTPYRYLWCTDEDGEPQIDNMPPLAPIRATPVYHEVPT